MQYYVIQVFVSMLLFFVLFFGISFLLNMILRSSWLMAYVYPVIVIFIVDTVTWTAYITQPGTAFPALWDHVINLKPIDIMVLLCGLAGTIGAGYVIKYLRKNGYQMF